MRNITYPRTSAIRAGVLFWVLLIAGYLLFVFNLEESPYDPGRPMWKSLVWTVLFSWFIILVATLRLIRDIKALYAAQKEKEDLTGLRIAHGHCLFSWNVFLGAVFLAIAVSASGAFLPLPLTPIMAFMCLVVFMGALWFTDTLLVSAFSAYSIAMEELENDEGKEDITGQAEKGGQP
jgi:hypothetical protein